MSSIPSQITQQPFEHPRLLRCDVVNRFHEPSVRFVELETFRLWEHMMRHRHGIEVRHLHLCLWLGEATFMRNAGPFRHAGTIEEVSRVTVSIFDERHSYFFDVKRYALAEEAGDIQDTLLARIPKEIRDRGDYELDLTPGLCVERNIEQPALELILGLSGFDESDEAGDKHDLDIKALVEGDGPQP
ncbi:MAG TPA: hypothetical protein VFP95_07465 [Gammaproteobacteria bacterium]|nr:hypothetical protein [Gammaproteobacteria bacterium]